MPAIYWLPLFGPDRPVPVDHVHAAFSRWFDGPDGEAGNHHDKVKPYRLSPVSLRDGLWGIELSILTEQAYLSLAEQINARTTVVLGGRAVQVGTPQPLKGCTWHELAAWPNDRAWRIEFLTPFLARTRNRATPFPTPAVALRASIQTWEAFSGFPPLRLSLEDQGHLWVSRVDLSTRDVTIARNHFPAALGSITCRTDDDAVAAKCSTLFRLAEYSGMGSFRGKGMGVVSVEPVK